MNVFLVLASLALTASAAPMSYKCPLIQLQEDVDFSRLAGDWDLRYTNSSEDMHCYAVNFYDIKPAEKKMRMQYNYIVTEDVDLIHRKNIIEDSMQMSHEIEVIWGGKTTTSIDEEGSGSGDMAEKEDEENYIAYKEDYIATDYDTYLIIGDCDETTGVMTINVFIRTKIDSDGRKYRVNIAQEDRIDVNYYLERLGNHIQTLDRIFYRRCDRAEDGFEQINKKNNA